MLIIQKDVQLKNSNGVKFFLMLLVVLYHSCYFWTGEWFTENPLDKSIFLSFFSKWLNSFHIYGFTLVSGYIYYFIYYEKKGYLSYKTFIQKKILRLLVPYITVAIIWVIPIQKFFFKYDLKQIFENYVLGFSPNQLWFLLMLLWLFIIVYPITPFLRKKKGIVVVLCFYLIGIVFNRLVGNFIMIPRAFMYLFFFWLGFKLRQGCFEFIWNMPTLVYFCVHFLLFLFTEYLFLPDMLIGKVVKYIVQALVHGLGAIMSFVIFERLFFILPNRIQKRFNTIAKFSMPIYLFHQQIIYFVIYLLNGKISPVLICFINFIISLCGALIISIVFMRFKVTRFLIGEK